MDLLTAVMHELGHVLGDADLRVADHPHDLMAQNTRTGVRRVPGSVAHELGQTSEAPQTASFPLVVGTLPASKRIAVLSGGTSAQPAASASTTTLAVSTPATGIGGGLALFDVTKLGPVLAGLAMRRRRAA